MQHEALSVYRAILKRQKAAAEASATPANVGKPGTEEDRADAKRRDGKGHFMPKVDKAAKGAQQKRG